MVKFMIEQHLPTVPCIFYFLTYIFSIDILYPIVLKTFNNIELILQDIQLHCIYHIYIYLQELTDFFHVIVELSDQFLFHLTMKGVLLSFFFGWVNIIDRRIVGST